MPDTSTTRTAEAFTPAVKACRDVLVDDVERHLGVPILCTPAPVVTITAGDVERAGLDLARAIAMLDGDPTPPGPHVQAARLLLEQVVRLLGAAHIAAVPARRLRPARRQLGAATDHLTEVMFADPDTTTTSPQSGGFAMSNDAAATTFRRTFLVPDLDGEVVAATEPIEELLLSLADGADEDPPLHTTLHQPAAEAAGLLRVAIDQAPVARLFGTDGRYEHEGHAVVTVDETVMARFAAAVEELVAALRPGARADVADFLDHWAGDRHTTAENLVGLATRFVELCRLPWDADHDVLTEPLTHAQSSLERTVLTDDQEAAYRRLRDRFVGIWHADDPLARWQY